MEDVMLSECCSAVAYLVNSRGNFFFKCRKCHEPCSVKQDGVHCDFCNSTEIIKRYKCRNFNSDSETVGVRYGGMSIVLQSVEEWAACANCARFIDNVQLEELINYAVERYTAAYGAMSPGFLSELRKHISHTYQLFLFNKQE